MRMCAQLTAVCSLENHGFFIDFFFAKILLVELLVFGWFMVLVSCRSYSLAVRKEKGR